MSGQVIGMLETATAERISGWACIDGNDIAVEVQLKLGDEVLATVRADRPREDLVRSAQHPTGICGFVCDLRALGRTLPADVPVHARVLGAPKDLQWSRQLRARWPAPPPPPLPEPVAAPAPTVVFPDFPLAPTRSPLRIAMDSLHALFLREVRQRYGAFRFGYFWAIVQPVLFIILLSESRHLIGAGRRDLYDVDGLYFFQLGVLPYFMFQHAYHQAMGAMAGSRGLFGHRQLQPIDIILVRSVLEFSLLLAVFGILTLGLYWFGARVDLENPMAFLAVIGLLFVFSVGFGLIADVFVTRNEEARRIFSLLERPLFFISGVFFTIEIVPEPLRSYLLWNPLLHLIDLARGSMLHEYHSLGSWLYASLWAFGLLFLGLGLYRRNLSRITS